MKVKIAAFKHVDYEWVSFYKFDESMPRGYARCTEWTEIELPDLPPAKFVANALEELDGERLEAMAASARALERIEDTRRKYLALTYQGVDENV